MLPTYRDINLLDIDDDVLYGMAGETGQSLALEPSRDVRMCASGELSGFIGGMSSLLATVPQGMGLTFEAEVGRGEIPPPSVSDKTSFVHEVLQSKWEKIAQDCRTIHYYAHLWTSGINPLRLPLLPRLLPGRGKKGDLKTSLEQNATTIREGTASLQASLGAMGVKSRVMSGKEVVSHFWRILCPEKSEVVDPVATGQFTLRSELAAANTLEARDHFFCDGYFHAGVSFYEYADELKLGALDALLESLPFGARYVVSILVPDQESYLTTLKAHHRKATGFVAGSGTKDFESKARYDDLDEIITRCREQGERIYTVSVSIILKSKNLDDLAEWRKEIVFLVRQLFGATALIEDMMHRRIFLSTLPMNAHVNPRRNLLIGGTIGALIPLSRPWPGTGAGGLLMTTRSRETISLDLFQDETPRHGIIVATTGGGKSFTANMLLLSLLADPLARALVIDIGGSYRRLAEIVGGAYFDVRVEEKYAINPLLPKSSLTQADGSFDSEMLAAQTSLLMRFLPGGGSGTARLVIEKALERTYRDKEEPLLSDLYEELSKGAWDTTLKATTEAVAIELRQYVESVYAKLLSRPSKIRPFESPLTVFDLAGLKEHKNLQSILVSVIAFSLNRQLSDRSVRKLIIIDEGWELFNDPSAADLISKLYRQARKQNGAILSISQSPVEFLESAVSPAIMANIHWVMALKMSSNHDKLSSFGFTDQAIEQSKTLTMMPRAFSEVMIRWGDAPNRIARISPSSLEYWAATTNASECVREAAIRREKNLTPTEAVHAMAEKEPVLPW